MTEITNEMWRKAMGSCWNVYQEALYPITRKAAYKFIERYDNGERSVSLYNAIMELE